MNEQEMLISSTQAAEMLNVTIPTIRRWIEDGTLRGYQKNPGKRGSPYQIFLSSVQKILDQRKHQSDTGPLGRLPKPTLENATEN